MSSSPESSERERSRSHSGDSASSGGHGLASSVGSAPLLRQFVTLSARFNRHTETLYATSDTSLADLGRLLVKAGGCVQFRAPRPLLRRTGAAAAARDPQRGRASGPRARRSRRDRHCAPLVRVAPLGANHLSAGFEELARPARSWDAGHLGGWFLPPPPMPADEKRELVQELRDEQCYANRAGDYKRLMRLADELRDLREGAPAKRVDRHVTLAELHLPPTLLFAYDMGACNQVHLELTATRRLEDAAVQDDTSRGTSTAAIMTRPTATMRSRTTTTTQTRSPRPSDLGRKSRHRGLRLTFALRFRRWRTCC